MRVRGLQDAFGHHEKKLRLRGACDASPMETPDGRFIEGGMRMIEEPLNQSKLDRKTAFQRADHSTVYER